MERIIQQSQFKKGMTPWNKGIAPSDETKRQISETKKRLFREGKIIISQKGKKFEEIYGTDRAKELREQFSQSHKGIPLSQEHRQNISEANKGRIVKEETRMKIRDGNLGKHRSPNTEFKKGQSLEDRFGIERAREIRIKLSQSHKKQIAKTTNQIDMHGKRWEEYIKGKTYEEIYGIEQAKEIKEKLRNRYKGKTHEEMWGVDIAKQWKERMRAKREGKTYDEFYGKEKSKLIRDKHSARLKGKTYEELYGIEGAKIRKKMVSNALKGRTYIDRYGVDKAKELRLQKVKWRSNLIFPSQDTKIEVKVQNYLKELGVEFFTHQYIQEIEHSYQCDILIPALNLVIECDGDYWHHYPIGNEIDHIHTKELLAKGFKVLRLWEHEIKVMDINQFKERVESIKLDTSFINQCKVR